MGQENETRNAPARLQKFLAECGVASRRKAEALILESRVTVNGAVVAALGTKVDPAKDIVCVDGKEVRKEPKGLLLLYKPRNVVSTMSDPEGRPTVADYLTKKYRSYFPVGRLDFESEGLVLMTNDGELGERLLHPRYELERKYELTVEGRVGDAALEKIERGVLLDDGEIRAQVQVLGDYGDTTALEVVIREGRNRVLRRLFDRLGHPVRTLKRIAHGPYRLGSLRPGEIRPLPLTEFERLRREVLASEAKEKETSKQNGRGRPIR